MPGSSDESNGAINEEQSLADLKSEASDIKARLAHLEEILSAENSCSSNRNTNDSATVQLILMNKTMGWKVALRKLQLKFGVNMLGNPVLREGKVRNSTNLMIQRCLKSKVLIDLYKIV